MPSRTAWSEVALALESDPVGSTPKRGSPGTGVAALGDGREVACAADGEVGVEAAAIAEPAGAVA
jgi:hypothetical protein